MKPLKSRFFCVASLLKGKETSEQKDKLHASITQHTVRHRESIIVMKNPVQNGEQQEAHSNHWSAEFIKFNYTHTVSPPPEAENAP